MPRPPCPCGSPLPSSLGPTECSSCGERVYLHADRVELALPCRDCDEVSPACELVTLTRYRDLHHDETVQLCHDCADLTYEQARRDARMSAWESYGGRA